MFWRSRRPGGSPGERPRPATPRCAASGRVPEGIAAGELPVITCGTAPPNLRNCPRIDAMVVERPEPMILRWNRSAAQCARSAQSTRRAAPSFTNTKSRRVSRETNYRHGSASECGEAHAGDEALLFGQILPRAVEVGDAADKNTDTGVEGEALQRYLGRALRRTVGAQGRDITAFGKRGAVGAAITGLPPRRRRPQAHARGPPGAERPQRRQIPRTSRSRRPAPMVPCVSLPLLRTSRSSQGVSAATSTRCASPAFSAVTASVLPHATATGATRGSPRRSSSRVTAEPRRPREPMTQLVTARGAPADHRVGRSRSGMAVCPSRRSRQHRGTPR